MQSFITWVLSHQALVSGAAVGILDLAFALSPKLAAQGLLHQVYLWLQKLSGKTPPAA